MEFILENGIALLTLTFLEIVLGVDNVIFVSIVTNKLPESTRKKGRVIGLSIALLVRILLLACLSWIIHGFVKPLFSISTHDYSLRDLILLAGGLFLLAKSTSEIHHKVNAVEQEDKQKNNRSFVSVILQIVLIDVVFSFDSILTAIGLSDNLGVMITAIILAMIVMILFSGHISKFINKYPTVEILALSFLILIGFMLVLEGALHEHVPKGYIYFAVFFSLIVEVINIKLRKNKKEVVEEHQGTGNS